MDLSKSAFRSQSILHIVIVVFLSLTYFFTVTFLVGVHYAINLSIVLVVICGFFVWKLFARQWLWRKRKAKILALRKAELIHLKDLDLKDPGISKDMLNERSKTLRAVFSVGFVTWVDTTAYTGATESLRRAGTAGHYGLALQLVAQGARVKGLLSKAVKELSGAVYTDHKSRLLRIVDLLFALGEELTEKDFRHLWSWPELVEYSLSRGHDVNRCDRKGINDLMAFAMDKHDAKGRAASLKLIIARIQAIDERDKSQKTALIIAAEHGNTPVVRHLLDAGADRSIKDKSGRTALRYALKSDATAMIRLLE